MIFTISFHHFVLHVHWVRPGELCITSVEFHQNEQNDGVTKGACKQFNCGYTIEQLRLQWKWLGQWNRRIRVGNGRSEFINISWNWSESIVISKLWVLSKTNEFSWIIECFWNQNPLANFVDKCCSIQFYSMESTLITIANNGVFLLSL